MEAVATTTEQAGTGRGAFLWGRLGSLLSILPLGVWTTNHIWDNLKAFQGAKEWESAVTGHGAALNPFTMLFTFGVVMLPLVLHTIWGLARLKDWRPNNTRWGTFANLRFALQRLSALGLAGFLGAHIYLAFIRPRFLMGHAEPFSDIAREMRFHTPTLIVYLLGTLGAAYHLGNGIATFVWKWGVSGEKASRRFELLGILFFLVLLAGSWGAIYALWEAGAQYGGGATPVPGSYGH